VRIRIGVAGAGGQHQAPPCCRKSTPEGAVSHVASIASRRNLSRGSLDCKVSSRPRIEI
jgi:hypothetical protein